MTIHDHTYNHGLAVASTLRLHIRSDLHGRERPHQPHLRMAEGRYTRDVTRLVRRRRGRDELPPLGQDQQAVAGQQDRAGAEPSGRLSAQSTELPPQRAE